MTVTDHNDAPARPFDVELSAEAALPERGEWIDRLLTQRGFFAAPFDRVPDDVYCTVERGDALRRRDAVVVEPYARVSTNTFFGRFPASYWQRWTAATEVLVEVTASGDGVVSIVASDGEGKTRVVQTQRVAGRRERLVTLAAAIDRFVDGGALWLEVAADDASLTVSGVRWSVSATRALRPTAVVMCTFNRPQDCLHTLGVLAADHESMAMVDAVYVIDQGTDTIDSRAEFVRVAELLGPKLHYRQQPNLGGAGGFTRGLYEVAEVQHAEHANVLFMDDDILLEPDTVVRMTAFANRTVKPVIVGAQMLYLLHPELTYSWAQSTDLRHLRGGVPVPRDVLRVDVTRHRQDVRVDAGYNAWWSCLIPSEVVASAGYPLPMFFQWDDIEYGHRAKARGHATVTLPGAGVWHADWDWKDEDGWAGYFNHRNTLITAALHTDFDAKAAAGVIRHRVLKYLVTMRYGLTATALQGVEDFLAGPGCLHDGGLQAAAAVQELRAKHPETRMHPASALPGVSGDLPRIVDVPPAPSRKSLVLVKRFLWQLLGRSSGSASVRASDARWWHVSRFVTVVVTDASRQGVHLRQVDRRELIKQGLRALRLLRRLRREGRSVAQSYRAALPDLTSRDNWRRLFEAGE
ncbi:MAG: glycosyltransferase [Pseudonocardia sp.]